ncbi:hypothetical protein ACNT8L_18170 [Brucella intermedia]|uniref:DUF7946 domain-containing protein n=1 Tax=Brucella intermedia TaxID=94625 RepID=UPI003AB72E17
MNIEKIDPICIKFEGLDASNNAVELSVLASSLQGASKIIAASGQVALAGRFSKKEIQNDVRVLGLPPQAGSYEFWIAVTAIATPLATPMFPLIETAIKTAATKAVEGMTNYVISKWAGRKPEMQTSNEVAVKALEEMGHTARHAMDMVERVALSNHSGAKQLVSPIGLSAQFMRIGHVSTGSFPIGQSDRDEIERAKPIEIGEERVWRVQITELDRINQTCKVSLVDDPDIRKRIDGKITDPQIVTPNNAYTSAFDNHDTIAVKCKPQYQDGELDRIFISDVVK